MVEPHTYRESTAQHPGIHVLQKAVNLSDEQLMDVLERVDDLDDWPNWKNRVLFAMAQEAHQRGLIGG